MDEMNRQATGQRAGLEHGSRPFVGAQIVERRARRSGHDVRGDRAAGDRTTYRLHHDSDEVAYVLSREITCKVDDVVTVGGPGVCAFMPHALNNTGTDAARVLFLYTPGVAGKFFEEREQFQRSRARRLTKRRRSHAQAARLGNRRTAAVRD